MIQTRHIHKNWNLIATSWLSAPCGMCQFLIGSQPSFGVDSPLPPFSILYQ
ncbi:hypothetical protein ISN45_At05g000740 [Arabidopsis thaliana x Arabidopsis arenosa]|uniref:Uncharacterized protein n=2 Tax=Arabidopsis TaxID=3701 RepID=A0A8T2DBE3_ARASU|nr:hypothetical protein ISN45_At05g000740 [Arabidopsis thaliana x Arabidopsis arenosa]KAG7607762.1 hypothetical protein ISN44_As05g000800 [Arabidopsis suecica]